MSTTSDLQYEEDALNDLQNTNLREEDMFSPQPDGEDDDETDQSLVDSVLASDGNAKITLPATITLPPPPTTAEYNPRHGVFSCPNHTMDPKKLFEQLANFITPPRQITKLGKCLFNIWFATSGCMEVLKKSNCKVGKLVREGFHIDWFYRMIYVGLGLRGDHEGRLIDAFKTAIDVKAISATINVEKKLVSIYLAGLSDFGTVYSSPEAQHIKVPAQGAMAPAYWIHLQESNAHSNNPACTKFLISNIPAEFDKTLLLQTVRRAVSPIMKPSSIIGASIYTYPDTNRPARFGFCHVLGKQQASFLQRVEIPIEGIELPLTFQIAVDKPMNQDGAKRGQDDEL